MHVRILKGPKLETFGSRVFTQIRPVCFRDLGIDKTNQNFNLKNRRFVLYKTAVDIAKKFEALSAMALKIFQRWRRRRYTFLSAVGESA